MVGFLDDKSSLDASSRVVYVKVGGASQLTVGRVIVIKHRSRQERGYPRIIPPLRNRPLVNPTCTSMTTLSAVPKISYLLKWLWASGGFF